MGSLIRRWLWYVFLGLMVARDVSGINQCDGVWFGYTTACPFKCRYKNYQQCGNEGYNSDPTCEDGWFGPACQYVDLTLIGATKLSGAVVRLNATQLGDVLSDGDDTTCLANSDADTVTVTWSSPYVFTWLRIVVNGMDYTSSFTVQFRENVSPDSPVLSCTDRQTTTSFWYDKYTKDLYCSLNVTVRQVILTGPGVRFLCSLHVSGGRNVALRQATAMTSQHTFYNARIYGPDKGVDGNTKTCMSTQLTYYNRDPQPTWQVQLSQPVLINRYVLYNTGHNQELRGFVIQSFNANDELIFQYQDQEPQPQHVYTILSLGVKQPIKTVRVLATEPTDNGHAVKWLNFCELELYGDSSCQPGQYGRECEGSCKCSVTGETCMTNTGKCLSGCAAGFYGDGCTSGCPATKYGVDCLLNCSVDCYNQLCNPVTGKCYDCEPRRSGNFCANALPVCDKGWFGPRCQYKCHCTDDDCDDIYGNCRNGASCSPGLFGTACQFEDLAANMTITLLPVSLTTFNITDGDDDTCLQVPDVTSLRAALPTDLPFTWLRLHFNTSVTTDTDIGLTFRDSSKRSRSCDNKVPVVIGNHTLDIHCDMNVTVDQVTLTGDSVQFLCSLYISGGRNVALRQQTIQFTDSGPTYFDYSSRKAVDGAMDLTIDSTNCTRGRNWWTINFQSPQVINRVIIYTNNYTTYDAFVDTHFDEMLGNFSVETYAGDGSLIYTYTRENELNPQKTYTVFFFSKTPVVTLKIHGGTDYWRKLLLCEVEIYGDTVCAPGTYGRECEKLCRCNGTATCGPVEGYDSFYPSQCKTEVPKVAVTGLCPDGRGVLNGYIKPGATATCTCRVIEPGYPAGHAQWFTADGNKIGTAGNVSVLTLTNLNYKLHDGQQPYSCRSLSAIGQTKAGSEFNPQWAYGPLVTTFTVNGTQSVVVNQGSDVLLYCDIEANPPAVAVIKGNGFGRVKENTSQGHDLTIPIKAIQCDDAGLYTCQGRNPLLLEEGSGSLAYVEINVKCPPKLKDPALLNKKQTFRVSLDKDTTLSFEIAGYPEPPTFTLKTETGLLDPSKYSVTYTHLTPPFGLVSVKHQDANTKFVNTYTLSMTNAVGQSDVTYDIIKEETPVTPEPDVTKNEDSERSIIIMGVLGGALGLLLITTITLCCLLSRQKARENKHPEYDSIGSSSSYQRSYVSASGSVKDGTVDYSSISYPPEKSEQILEHQPKGVTSKLQRPPLPPLRESLYSLSYYPGSQTDDYVTPTDTPYNVTQVY
ncbi:unnamed protein product [Lymnaea stagnalis]|uniref:Ig-like domain-containing protein n=1 Tax=Lymnaea stagnalis TaxID=6523 RepID=A0AAV2HRU6_LYMST